MIAAAVARVASGAGREVCLIAGEAGMGKTTLAAITAGAALEQGACVLFGHCEEDLSSPYQLFAEALTGLVNEIPDAQLLLLPRGVRIGVGQLGARPSRGGYRACRRRRQSMPTPSGISCSPPW